MRLRDHPRWPLYRKLRRAIARELEADRRRLGLAPPVSEGDVDDYLEERFDDVVGDLEALFMKDIEQNTRWYSPESKQVRGGMH